MSRQAGGGAAGTAPSAGAPRQAAAQEVARGSLAVQLLEVAIDAPLAERDPPLGGEIGGDARALRDALVQRDQPRHLLLEALHALGEGIAQTLDDLEQREVHVGQPAAEHIRSTALLDDALEVAQKLRHPVAPEILGAPF